MEIKTYFIMEYYNDGGWDGCKFNTYGPFATKELAIKFMPSVVKYALMDRGYSEELAERMSLNAGVEKLNVGFGSPYEEEITSYDYMFYIEEKTIKIIEEFDKNLNIKKIRQEG